MAPTHAVVVCVKDAPEVTQLAERLDHQLAARGLRVTVDRHTDVGLGRRLTDWELKGVPVRLEIGPRDLAQGTVSLTRRDRQQREPVRIEHAVDAATDAVAAVHDALLADARRALEQRTTDVTDVAAAAEAAQSGLARLPWALCGPDGERRLHQAGVSVRCLTRPDGSVPDGLQDDDLIAVVARAY